MHLCWSWIFVSLHSFAINLQHYVWTPRYVVAWGDHSVSQGSFSNPDNVHVTHQYVKLYLNVTYGLTAVYCSTPNDDEAYCTDVKMRVNVHPSDWTRTWLEHSSNNSNMLKNMLSIIFCCHLNVFMSHNIGCIKLNVDLCKHALAVGYLFGHNGILNA